MKKFRIIVLVLAIVFIFIITVCTYFIINLKAVSKDSTLKEVTINEGSIKSVAITLKENNLIRNVDFFSFYSKITNKNNLKAGVYSLSEDMGVKKILNILSEGTYRSPDEVSITFKEGINIRRIASLIDENTNIKYDDVINKLKDTNYIDSLIDKYWFLTEDIKNSNIYYPLEGYLYPNTYRFNKKTVTVEEIFEKMLTETDRQLSKYKKDIEKSKLSVHEIITLSSIVELEGKIVEDRKAVAGVFYNRLASNSSYNLGSDATTYYAAKIDDWSQSLTIKELNDCSNLYNTRCPSNSGLPVGAICNPSISSIEATINPKKHDNYYFVNDCAGKVYLSKNEREHNNTINKLKSEDNWCS